MKSEISSVLRLGSFVGSMLLMGASTAYAACPTDPITAATFSTTPGNIVGGVAIDSQCRFAYATRSNGTVEVRGLSTSTGTNSVITVGATPAGLDFSPSGNTLFVANSGETTISVINLQSSVSTKSSLPALPGNQKPVSIAVSANGTVIVTTDAGTTGGIQLLQYDASNNTFRNRTSEIAGGITSANLKANGDRSLIVGINGATQSYQYVSATDSFAVTANTTAAAGIITALDSTGKLRYSLNTNATGNGTITITNIQTGAVIARMLVRSGVAANVGNALAVSADGSLGVLATTTGIAVVDLAPATRVRSMALSTLYGPSFIRVYNTGTVAGTVGITLNNPTTGTSYGTWTSPTIAAGAESQFAINNIEAALNITNKPFRYALALDAPRGFFGYMQALLWNPTAGTISNLSTCDRDINLGSVRPSLVSTDAAQLSGVQSSLLGGYNSQVIITSTSNTSQAVVLDIYDARNGNKLGTYTSAAVTANGQLTVSVAQIEGIIGAPTTDMLHYVVVARAPFSGYLQHRLFNTTAGVFTDLSAACVINSDLRTAEAASTLPGGVTGTVNLGPLYSTSQSDSLSFLRLNNDSALPQTATINLTFQDGGSTVTRTWVSPPIAAGAELQVPIVTIENQVPAFNKPATYGATISMPFAGSVQHVVWRPNAGSLMNLSTCVSDGPDDLKRLNGVHSSALVDYPSYVVINNNLNFGSSVEIEVIDAVAGTRLGTYISPTVAGHGNLVVSVKEIETAIGITPGTRLHYNLVGRTNILNGVDPNFFLQNLVLSSRTGTLEDMSKTCRPI